MSLNSVIIKSDAEIGDIKRARMLFDSLVKSNPKLTSIGAQDTDSKAKRGFSIKPDEH